MLGSKTPEVPSHSHRLIIVKMVLMTFKASPFSPPALWISHHILKQRRDLQQPLPLLPAGMAETPANPMWGPPWTLCLTHH